MSRYALHASGFGRNKPINRVRRAVGIDGQEGDSDEDRRILLSLANAFVKIQFFNRHKRS